MSQSRKSQRSEVVPPHGGARGPVGPVAEAVGLRPLSARSAVASVLLGMDPPALSPRLLVRSGELLGVSEGTTRTALSRMVAAGELEHDAEGRYRLAGRLLARHGRQQASRRARVRDWDGGWVQALVVGERRSAPARAELRTAMATLHLAEVREGVWVRPDNLDPDRFPAARAVVAEQCRGWRSAPTDDDPAALAARLWDLEGWAADADRLLDELAPFEVALAAADTDALAPGFVAAAGVLRHLLADPLLPDELVPADWPGPRLRATYERYLADFQATWRTWFRTQT